MSTVDDREKHFRYSRRGFLKRAGAGAGAVALSGGIGSAVAPRALAARSATVSTSTTAFGRRFPDLPPFAPATDGVRAALADIVQAVLTTSQPAARPATPSLPRRYSVERDNSRFAGAFQPRGDLGRARDGRPEVLCGAELDNKNPRFPGISSLPKPSDGLEPSTPSLPWRLRASVHRPRKSAY